MPIYRKGTGNHNQEGSSWKDIGLWQEERQEGRQESRKESRKERE